MLSLCKTVPGRKNICEEDASCVVAEELRQDWIRKRVYRNILRDYLMFREFRKVENRSDRKKTLSWLEKAGKFNNRMRNHAYDIRSKSIEYDGQLAKEYGVRMTMEDQVFWYDNCYGDYIVTSTSIIPRNWSRNKKRVLDREEVMNIKRSKMNEAIYVTYSGDNSGILIHDDDDDDDVDNNNDDDSEYEHYMSASDLSNNCDESHVTRFVGEPNNKTKKQFPSIQIRSGHKTIHEPLMRCLVHCISKYKVTTNDLMGITESIANTIFDQN
ncbi:hypothetical protein LOTGIDRAFT_173051 [Lottia gigantea]|uniref:Uncharacterized protein n=1 Tax=Lottia gigantea TaxID=225164 RepID=V4A9W1_LOTGI|nr:hypothetical protein LOTGIDRAFT_173051 [Lottia gigantea]ESP00784.1 hypothetical protein LOTGIDRAFT_173051 [Lottia gigantea]